MDIWESMSFVSPSPPFPSFDVASQGQCYAQFLWLCLLPLQNSTMANIPKPPAPPCKNAFHIRGKKTVRKVFEMGIGLRISASSVCHSAEDLKSLDTVMEIDGSSPRGVLEGGECEIEFHRHSSSSDSSWSVACTSDSDFQTNTKISPQLLFLRKLKKAPVKSLHTLYPVINSFHSIKKPSRKKKSAAHSLSEIPPDLGTEIDCSESSFKNFTLAELEVATGNFSRENIIGEGGYSEVYKGHLNDGQAVAVKRLNRGTPEEITADFLTELGILAHVNHPNISRAIGYGIEGGMHLVLPLSSSGSLASLLDGDKEKLMWCNRYKIALGTASGLSYLHEECQRRIIHRDIKAANVLLTQNFEPQISDFGLAKWLPNSWTHITVSEFEGTFGYLPPEFFMHGMVDEKIDVYAYGVLLLELITGRPALDKSQKSLVLWAVPLMNNGNTEELLDPSLSGDYDLEQMNHMISIASLCVHQVSSERPTMSQVVCMLKTGALVLENRKTFHRWPSFKRPFSEDIFDGKNIIQPNTEVM